MKKINKVTFISTGMALGAAAIVVPTAIALAQPKRNIENSFNPSNQLLKLTETNKIEGEKPTTAQTQKSENAQFKIERLNTRTEEQYRITIINNDKYGTVTFENGTNEYIATPGETVKLKVQVKNEYLDSHTIVNLEVFDQANPNYSLGVVKIDDNNYEFTMPNGGEDGKWFYQSGQISAKITYGLQKLGKWNFDFKSKHYIFNVTEDNFVYDDVANPDLKMQKYPSGEFVIYRIQLNGHNIRIKNMTIPKNVQFEICDTYDKYETTENSPVVGFVQGGIIDQQGAAGIWRGVKATFNASSQFGWGLNEYADSKFDL